MLKSSKISLGASAMNRIRKYLFKQAVDLCEIPIITIVDLGCIKKENPAPNSYGWSTKAWVELTTAIVYTVDIDPQSIKTSKRVLSRHLSQEDFKRVVYRLQDATDFLEHFTTQIDILYFDGPGEKGSRNSLRVSNKLLKAGSVILFDDCDLPESEDGRRSVIPDAIDMGFKVTMDNKRQVLMKRV